MPAAPTYNLKYQFAFKSEQNEVITIQLSGKNAIGDVVYIQHLSDQSSLVIHYPNSEEDKFSPIRGSEASINLVLEEGDDFDLSSLLGADDEWKVDAYRDDLTTTYWQGYILQEESTRPLDDRPYVVQLKAVDGIGLIRDKPLIRATGVVFDSRVLVLTYLSEILWQVNPYLGLVTHVNIFEGYMANRSTSVGNDPLAQCKIDARTFLKDAATFEDSYTVLEKILTAWGCTLFQYHGNWHIVDLWDYTRGVTSYTIYTYNNTDPVTGHVPINSGGVVDDDFTAKIAPFGSGTWSGTINPVNENQVLGLKYANKSVKLTYRYTPPENLVNNQNLNQLGSFIAPVNGYNIVGWTQKHKDIHQQTAISNVLPYIKVITNAFGYETDRYLVIPIDTAADSYPVHNYIINNNDNFFVNKDDKLEFSITYRYNNDLGDSNSTNAIIIMGIQKDGTPGTNASDWYTATTGGGWISTAGQQIGINLVGLDSREWRTISFETTIPGDGTLYLALGVGDNIPAGNEIWYKELQLNYIPYIRGGYVPVKGDYNLMSQDEDFKNKKEIEIFVSDAPKRVLKGAMFRNDGITLTANTWYREGITEARRFGEIQALKRYWHTLKTRYKIEGDFEILFFDYISGLLPIGLLNLFYPEYIGEEKYMLTEWEADLKTGIWQGLMIETGTETDDPDTNEFNYLF